MEYMYISTKYQPCSTVCFMFMEWSYHQSNKGEVLNRLWLLSHPIIHHKILSKSMKSCSSIYNIPSRSFIKMSSSQHLKLQCDGVSHPYELNFRCLLFSLCLNDYFWSLGNPFKTYADHTFEKHLNKFKL